MKKAVIDLIARIGVKPTFSSVGLEEMLDSIRQRIKDSASLTALETDSAANKSL